MFPPYQNPTIAIPIDHVGEPVDAGTSARMVVRLSNVTVNF